MLRSILAVAVMPPLSLFVLGAIGAIVHRRRPRLGKSLVLAAVAGLYVLSMPVVAAALAIGLQRVAPLDAERLPSEPQAIVVLGGDFQPGAVEYGGSTVGALSLERLRYAARLARRSGLPIITCGGRPRADEPPVAVLMKDALEQDFGVDVRWTEDESFNTRQNLAFAAEILRADGITRVFVVTHAWHMPRALREARAAGLDAAGAPTAFRTWPPVHLPSILPSARALRESSWALHEWIGGVWYALTG